MLCLAIWLPATQHALMEQAGLIHQGTAGSQHDDDHDAADGICVNAASHVQAPHPSLSDQKSLSEDVVTRLPSSESDADCEPDATVLGLPDGGMVVPGVAPPELPQTWHFTSRTSLPARAPSFLA